ncbi:hypothetical protein [Streptomyces gardneri]|uniref:Uncharacterized protein n=1 Tax=Streptomyces gardneri TaxID=66892 RepID=A0A4Y3RTT2_9ACTN|nr:hypothetical protein [Streptomyces gardneri]GEB60143.1 hypothetical protein SGA01_57480 [Streptomyces gardneri]GHH21467.1 hypothetical protein GCM10017674_76260 [Streptomyces gardneri]
MAEQPTTPAVDFSPEVNIHPVDELTLGTYTGRSDDKEDFFES